MPPSLGLLLISAFVEEGVGTGWTVEYAAYYGDIIVKNFAQSEEVHNRLKKNLTDGIAEQIKNGSEKMYLTSGVFARVLKSEFKAHQRINAKGLSRKHPDLFSFGWWLAGITDSDGGFSIEKSGEGKYVWVYFVDQHKYNERLLIYVKKVLGVGSIRDSGGDMRKYRIRKKEELKNIIIPLFRQLNLLTSKMYKFNLWVEALEIMESDLTREEKIKKIEKKREEMRMIPKGYKSQMWEGLELSNIEEIKGPQAGVLAQSARGMDREVAGTKWREGVMNRHWIGGFTEGDGSFYITKKDVDRFSLGYGITQRGDKHVLECIRKILHISARVVEKGEYNKLNTTNRRSIEGIIRYYSGLLISKKDVEYKIWAKAGYYMEKGKKGKMERYQRMLRRLRDKSGIGVCNGEQSLD